MQVTKENFYHRFLVESSNGAWRSSPVNFNFLTNNNDLKNYCNEH